jgi:hypothetical protein
VAAVKLAGFVFLLVAIFVWAHVVGGTVGPVTTGHSQVQYTGDDAGTGGMDMGGMDMGGHP